MAQNDILKGVAETLKEAVNRANAVGNRIREATSSQQDRVNEFLTNSDDEKVTKYREWREKIEAALAEQEKEMNEYAATKVGSVDSDFDAEAAKKEFRELRAEVTAKKKALYALFPKDEADAALADVEEIVGLRGATQTAGDTTKIREWAAAQGMKVSERGRLSSEVLDAYRKAHESE